MYKADVLREFNMCIETTSIDSYKIFVLSKSNLCLFSYLITGKHLSYIGHMSLYLGIRVYYITLTYY